MTKMTLENFAQSVAHGLVLNGFDLNEFNKILVAQHTAMISGATHDSVQGTVGISGTGEETKETGDSLDAETSRKLDACNTFLTRCTSEPLSRLSSDADFLGKFEKLRISIRSDNQDGVTNSFRSCFDRAFYYLFPTSVDRHFVMKTDATEQNTRPFSQLAADLGFSIVWPSEYTAEDSTITIPQSTLIDQKRFDVCTRPLLRGPDDTLLYRAMVLLKS